MTRSELIVAAYPNARILRPPDRALEQRLERLRAAKRIWRVAQAPFGFVFWLIEQRITRIDDEIERLRA